MSTSRNNTLQILDWDDTLFPTTWVSRNNIDLRDKEHCEKYQNYFNFLDTELYELLKTMLNCGNVIIVTNALMNWIYISSSVLPKTSGLLKLNNQNGHIKIISARGNYQDLNVNPMHWKSLAFKEELNSNIHNKQIKNIISIGDAEYEYKALQDLYNEKEACDKYLKAVRFLRYPSREILMDQLKVMCEGIYKICKTQSHLDLKFSNF